MTPHVTVFESRATVGLVPPESRPRIPGPVTSVTIHWNGPAVKITVAHAHSMCRKFWRGIQKFHMETRDWDDIAYTIGVCIHGVAMAGRGRGVRTAANGTKQGNDTSYAIYGLIGEGEQPSDAMLHAILDVAEALEQTRLRPHDFWKATGCPGSLKAWILAGHPRPQSGSTPTDPEEDDVYVIKYGAGPNDARVRRAQKVLDAAAKAAGVGDDVLAPSRKSDGSFDGHYGPNVRDVVNTLAARADLPQDGDTGMDVLVLDYCRNWLR